MTGSKKTNARKYLRKYLITFMVIPFSLIALIGFGAYQYLMEKEVVPITATKTTISITTGTPESISAASKQIYLYPDTTENFNFWGHDVLINYALQNSNHNIEITIDGNKETLIKSINEQCNDCAYSKKVGNITYAIRPVIWKTSDAGEKVWSFDTWNTRELYFEMVIEGVRGK